MKKTIEIECCSECPSSNMATTVCMYDGERELPDNVIFDRIIPEWCPLESRPQHKEIDGTFEIDFGGYCKAQIDIKNDKVVAVRAMNGRGNRINPDYIKVTK